MALHVCNVVLHGYNKALSANNGALSEDNHTQDAYDAIGRG